MMKESVKSLTKIEQFIFDKYYESTPNFNSNSEIEITLDSEIKDLEPSSIIIEEPISELSNFEIDENFEEEPKESLIEESFEIEALEPEINRIQQEIIEEDCIEIKPEVEDFKEEGNLLKNDYWIVLKEMTSLQEDLKIKQEDIAILFQNFKTEFTIDSINKLESIFLEFESKFEEFETFNNNLKKDGIDIDSSFLNYNLFFKEITIKNIQLIKSFFELLESKNKLITFFYENKNKLEDEIEENIKLIEKEKKVINDITILKSKDSLNEEYYNDLIINKENYIKELEDYNKVEKELIDLNIKNLLDEIKEIEIKIKEFNFSF